MKFDLEGMVRLVNNSSTPITLTYNSRTFRGQPGQDMFVPFPLAALHFGDPRTEPIRKPISIGDNKFGYIPSRHEEITRLSILYGIYNENDVEGIKARMPDITGYTIEDNEQIIFPLDDPKCLLQSDPETADEKNFLETQLHAMKQQMFIMQQMLDNRNNEQSERTALLPEDRQVKTSLSDESGVEEDSPNLLITGARSNS